jgi:hypothetical protein
VSISRVVSTSSSSSSSGGVLSASSPFYQRWYPTGRSADELYVSKNQGHVFSPANRSNEGSLATVGSVAPVWNNSNTSSGSTYGSFLSIGLDSASTTSSFTLSWPAVRQLVATVAPTSGNFFSAEHLTRIGSALPVLNFDGTIPTSVRVRLLGRLDVVGNSGTSGSYRASRMWVANGAVPTPPNDGNAAYGCMVQVRSDDGGSNQRAEVYVGTALSSTLYASSTTSRMGNYSLDVTFTATNVSYTVKLVGGASVTNTVNTTAYAPGAGLAMLVVGVQQSFATSLGGGGTVATTGLGPFDITFA